MNVIEWRNLSANEQSEIWPTLTHAERDVIIAADKTVLQSLLPADRQALPRAERPATLSRPQFLQEPFAAVTAIAPPIPSPVRSTSPDPVAVLADVRAKSCYGFLRSLTDAVALVGYLCGGALILFCFIVVIEDVRSVAPAWVYFLMGIGFVIGTTAAKQSALLLVDLVDLHLLNEARRRAESRS